jgi:transcriptional regulator with XRE-family HTH domain
MISASQLRAARALLNWSRDDLAAATGLHADALLKIEHGVSRPQRGTVDKIAGAFLEQGIIFTEDDGVRRQRSGIKIYEGREGFVRWYDDVYETAKAGGEICVSGCQESDYETWLSVEDDRKHTERMNQLGGQVSCRVILREGDSNFTYSSYVHYRWIAKDQWERNPLYLYGQKLAVVEFKEEGPTVTVIESVAAARAFKKIFDATWSTCRDVPQLRKAQHD